MKKYHFEQILLDNKNYLFATKSKMDIYQMIESVRTGKEFNLNVENEIIEMKNDNLAESIEENFIQGNDVFEASLKMIKERTESINSSLDVLNLESRQSYHDEIIDKTYYLNNIICSLIEIRNCIDDLIYFEFPIEKTRVFDIIDSLFKVFDITNVNFECLSLKEKIKVIEKSVMKVLNVYRKLDDKLSSFYYSKNE